MPLVVIAAGLLAYYNSLTCPFIVDYFEAITENPTIRHLWPIWEPLSPPRPSGATVAGRPLINLSLAINYALGGYNVWGYHALNLTVHILAGLTLLGIVRRTLLQPALHERFGAAANELALATAVLWTVHPLQTESVTFLIQRAESIMGLFYLLTLYCFIRGDESPRAGLWYGLCVSACTLGMASKEVMVSAPLMVMLYDRAFLSGSFQEAWRRRWPLYVGLSATWMLLGYLLIQTLRNAVTIAGYIGLSWWEYLATQPGVILYYLRLSVWPSPLCLDHAWPVARAWIDILPATVVVVILLGASAWAWRKKPVWGFAGVWFFLILAPSSSFIPLQNITYEHRMYLSLAAVVSFVVLGLYSLMGRQSWAVFVLMAISLGVLTWRRNQDYRSEIAIRVDAVTKFPNNPSAHFSLGLALHMAGRIQEAIAQYEEALSLKPEMVLAHYNLGNALVQLGRAREAIAHYEEALRVKPDLPTVHNNLGVALVQLGRAQEAIGHCEEALRLKPDLIRAHYNLGLALAQAGRSQDAVPHFEQALREKPGNPETHFNLGLALEQTGRLRESMKHYEEALRVKPDYAETQNNLAWLLATLTPAEGGDPGRAVTLAQRACELTGGRVAPYLDTLAAAYAATGRFDEAIATAQKAVELARAAGQPQVVEEIEAHLQLYRGGHAYRR